MADFATIADLEARPGVEFASTAERNKAEITLGDASESMRSELPLLDQWITDGKVSARMALIVCCDVTKRVLAAAETAGQPVIGEQHPEYGITLGRPTAEGYEMTEGEKANLSPQSSSRGAFSVIPSFTA